MPIYATIADLRVHVDEPQLVQLTAADGEIVADEAKLTRALEQADNVIDGYVGAIYRRIDSATPIPKLLRDIACDVALYRLFSIGRGSPTEHVTDLHKQAVKQLQDIARGVIKLDQGEEAFESRDGAVIVESSERLFSRDAMRGL